MARSSDTLVSFEQLTSSLHSPTAAMADPWTYVADRDSNLPKTGCFFVAYPAWSIVILVTSWLATRLALPKSRDSYTSVSTRPLYFTLGRAITLDTLPSVYKDKKGV